jgi:type IV secretion system protein VirB4
LLLTQSFTFLSRAAGQALLQRQHIRLINAGDFAVSQAVQLKDALDALTSNEFVMGDHHFSLQVFADVADACAQPDPWRLKPLNDRIALARNILGDTGMTVAREDLAIEAAFWAQLPGNFAMRPRKAPITSRNFAAMAPFHNYPLGRASGNHWGEALTLLCTSARSPYYFSLHASDPADPDGGSRKDTGHTFICGPTGSGKTVFIGFLITALERTGATQVIFDKDRGLEILVRALGGEYFELRQGQSTGFNPLQLPLQPVHLEFQKNWLRMLVRPPARRPLSTRESADLDHALRGTLALEPAARRLSRLLEFLDPTDQEGVHARLSRWCECAQGDYAWVFDNPADSVAGRLGGRTLIGFDVTEFLDHELTRAPITLYMFHLVRQLLDGRRLVCWMDEFWRLLADPAFESFAKDRQEYVNVRQRWATLTNAALREANVDARIDHRTLAAQGIDREPLPHIPFAQLKMERRGVPSLVAQRLRAEYRERVQRREERSADRTAATTQAGPAPAAAAGMPSQPVDIEQIRRQAREAWLRLKSKEADKAGGRGGERETLQSEVQHKDDLAR